MDLRCDLAIGSQPMGMPDAQDIETMIATMRLPESNNFALSADRSRLISQTASRILRAMIFHEPTANKHVISHRFQAKPLHGLLIAGPIFTRNIHDDVTPATVMRTLVGYAKKIRGIGPKAAYRAAKIPDRNLDSLIHPTQLFFLAASNLRITERGLVVPTANVQPGTPRYDWVKPVATVFNIEANIPLSLIQSLPGKRLCEVIDIPLDTLAPHEREAWQALTIRSASGQQVPSGKRLNLTLEPAWELLRDPRPGEEKPEQLKAWQELASVAECY